MLAPFSDRSKPWEITARSLRRLAGVSLGERLDPWKLAPKVGLRVVDLASVLAHLEKAERIHLLRTAQRNWSGGVYPRCLPDGSRVCVLNSNHSHRRQKITLMEEITHVHLRHEPSLLTVSDGVQVREYVEEIESEAYGVGAAALVPWDTPQVQGIVATLSCSADRNRASRASAGFLQLRVFRGLPLSAAATAARSPALCLLRSVPFGKY